MWGLVRWGWQSAEPQNLLDVLGQIKAKLVLPYSDHAICRENTNMIPWSFKVSMTWAYKTGDERVI